MLKFRFFNTRFYRTPGGGLETYRNGSAELGIFERPKKYFAFNRKPKKILSEKQNPKKTSETLFTSQKSSMI